MTDRAPLPSTDHDAPLGKAHVVVVDDDSALLNALEFSLEAEGYHVRIFSDQEHLLARPDIMLSAACVVVDYRLKPLDGLQLLAVLRARGLKAPAILVTTDPDDDCRRTAARLGVPIVEKPLLSDDLSQLIERLVGARNVH